MWTSAALTCRTLLHTFATSFLSRLEAAACKIVGRWAENMWGWLKHSLPMGLQMGNMLAVYILRLYAIHSHVVCNYCGSPKHVDRNLLNNFYFTVGECCYMLLMLLLHTPAIWCHAYIFMIKTIGVVDCYDFLLWGCLFFCYEVVVVFVDEIVDDGWFYYIISMILLCFFNVMIGCSDHLVGLLLWMLWYCYDFVCMSLWRLVVVFVVWLFVWLLVE